MLAHHPRQRQGVCIQMQCCLEDIVELRPRCTLHDSHDLPAISKVYKVPQQIDRTVHVSIHIGRYDFVSLDRVCPHKKVLWANTLPFCCTVVEYLEPLGVPVELVVLMHSQHRCDD